MSSVRPWRPRCVLQTVLATMALAAVVGAPASASAQGLLGKVFGESKPPVVDLADKTDFAAAFGEAFQQPGALAHAFRRPDFKERRIALASFVVEFPTELVGSSAGGAGAKKVSYTYFLRNTQPAQMQAVADKAHADFVSALQARGYEVLGGQALATPGFKNIWAEGRTPPESKERGALSKLMGNSETTVDNASVIVTATGTAAAQGFSIMSSGPLGNLARELGVPVAAVRIKLNFTRIDDAGGFAWAEVDAKPQNVVAVKGTQVDIYAPDRNQWNLPLQRALILPHAVADKAERMQVATGERASAVASVGVSAVLGFLGGSGRGGLSGAVGGTNAQDVATALGESQNFEIKAGADYEKNTGDDLQLVAQMLAQAFPK